MKKLLLSLFLLFTVLCTPAFADGGIPLWGLNTSVFFIYTAALGIPSSIYPEMWYICLLVFIVTALIFCLVVLVETVIIKKFINNLNFKKLFIICLKANLISTFAGIILLLIPTPYTLGLEKLSSLEFQIMGPWGFNGYYSLFLYNFLCLPLSYIVEYFYAKRLLQQDSSLKTIKISFLCANIATYALPILIYGIICIKYPN